MSEHNEGRSHPPLRGAALDQPLTRGLARSVHQHVGSPAVLVPTRLRLDGGARGVTVLVDGCGRGTPRDPWNLRGRGTSLVGGVDGLS